MLHRIKSPFKKRSEKSDLKYLQFTHPELYNYIKYLNEENDGSNRDDASSISSVSTNATMDNNPGTGRIIDKCIYQFFGRKLERFIFRISMANLSPNRIAQFLWMGHDSVSIATHQRLDFVIEIIDGNGRIAGLTIGNERIAGLKSLVKQTQSKSLYRSAAALSALIRLASSAHEYGIFYVAVAAVEPILHLESLANALDDAHPEKKYFLFLIGIARARVNFVTNYSVPEITEELAINCRQKLLKILDSSRRDPLAVISDACLLLADVSLRLVKSVLALHLLSPAPAAHSLIETAYFLLTFLVRFLIEQCQTIHSKQSLQGLIISTFSDWLQDIIDVFTNYMRKYWDMPQLMPICTFYILRLTISDMQLGFLSPRRMADRELSLDVFPRRMRSSTTRKDIQIIHQSYLSICAIRTRRLLASPDELRREAGDSMKVKYGWLSDGFYNLPFEEKLGEDLQRSLDRARSIQVVESDLTQEFLAALKFEYVEYKRRWGWKWYKNLQRHRHRMGEYCRSNLDWDWDTSSSLKRLFRIDRPKNSSRPEGAVHLGDKGVPTIHREINGGTLEVSIPEKAPNVLEKVVRIRYETEAGEVKYKTFYARPSVEDLTSDACADSRPRSSSAPETGPFTGESIEARGVVPEAVSRDEMKNTEVADEVHEEERCFRELNGVSDTEDDGISVDTRNRPQYNSRIDDWLETQVSAPMGD